MARVEYGRLLEAATRASAAPSIESPCQWPKIYSIRRRLYTWLTRLSVGGDKTLDFDWTRDASVRGAAFDWLDRQVSAHGEIVPLAILVEGFELDQRRIPLICSQGIFKPAVMQVPLSITTLPKGPYDHAMGPDNLLRYRYRGTHPWHRDNVGLRFAGEASATGLLPRSGSGRYVAMWPVYVTRDDPDSLVFSIAVDDASQLDLYSQSARASVGVAEARREYATSLARRRLY